MSEINTLVISDAHRAQIKEYIKQTTAYIDTLTKENEQMINDYEINKEQFDTIKKLSVNVSEEQKKLVNEYLAQNEPKVTQVNQWIKENEHDIRKHMFIIEELNKLISSSEDEMIATVNKYAACGLNIPLTALAEERTRNDVFPAIKVSEPDLESVTVPNVLCDEIPETSSAGDSLIDISICDNTLDKYSESDNTIVNNTKGGLIECSAPVSEIGIYDNT